METKHPSSILMAMKHESEPIVMLTCYDYPTARSMDEAGVDIIFIGDSLGTNILGYTSPCEVTMDDMLHHTKAVVRGAQNSLILADMPYRSYETPQLAIENANRFIATGAHMVKIEGGKEIAPVMRALSQNGICVMAHIGHTPQTHSGEGRVVVGITEKEAHGILEDAIALENAGAAVILMECVPQKVADIVTHRLAVPTIGIGSGNGCDGQVLVVNDLLGWNAHEFRFLKKYDNFHDRSKQHFLAFISDVKQRNFPSRHHIFNINTDEYDRFIHQIN